MTSRTSRSNDDEFSPATKALLARRSGDKCSYPLCEKATTLPIPNGGTKNLGQACHIIPASGKGPRASLRTPDIDVTAYDNGVWMCANHHLLVDRDDGRFTAEVLKAYRNRAEARAYASAEGSVWDDTLIPKLRSPVQISLVKDGDGRVTLDDHSKESIEAVLRDVNAYAYLGPGPARSVHALFAELILNGLSHGTTKLVTIEATSHTLTLHLGGETHTLDQLRNSSGSNFDKGGGRLSLELFEEESCGTAEVVERKRSSGMDIVIVGPGLRRLQGAEPCAIHVGGAIAARDLDLSQLAGCEVVHARLERLAMVSDQGSVRAAAEAVVRIGARLVVHCPESEIPIARKMLLQVAALDISSVEFRQ